MSALNGLLAIRRFHLQQPGISVEQVVGALSRISPDDAYHNYTEAIQLNDLISSNIDSGDPALFFREVLTELILKARPWWLRLAAYGRNRLLSGLTPNEAQCFGAAGLLSELPSLDILAWWDTIAQTIRADAESQRVAIGRTAEQLTIAYETERLARLGIEETPQWIAIEDSGAGYDVRSYDSGPVAPVTKLIEVKSSTKRPPEIFITRNEWETAVERGPNYWFHVWLLPEASLLEFKPADLMANIPENRQRGTWELVRIVL